MARRNRNRQPGPILRTLIQPAQPGSRPASNVALRTPVALPAVGPVRQRRAGSMAPAQRNSHDQTRSPWGQAQTLRPFTTPMMPAWSRTVSDVPVSGTPRQSSHFVFEADL